VYGVSALVAMYASKPRSTLSSAPPPPPSDPASSPLPARRQEDVADDGTAQASEASAA
jgi:hypothetical protein